MEKNSASVPIRNALPEDREAVWRIFHAVVSEDTFPFAPDTDRDKALRLRLSAPRATDIAEMDGKVAGTLPEAFNHSRLGFVDAHVMYRML